MPDRPTSEHGDDALLARLAAAMAPEDVRPPASTVAALHAAVAARGAAVEPERRLLVWAHRRWAVAGAAVALLTLGTGTAFAAGVPVPPPVRVLATDIGLPVTPQPVVDVRNATSSLQRQLRVTPTDPVGTAQAASHLAKLIESLPASQRSSVPAIASQLLHEACRQAFPATGGRAAVRTAPTGWTGCPAGAGGGGTAGRPTITVPTTKGGTSTPTWSTTSPGGHPGGGSGVPTTAVPGGPSRPGQPTTPTTSPGHGYGNGGGTGYGTGTGGGGGGGTGSGTGTGGGGGQGSGGPGSTHPNVSGLSGTTSPPGGAGVRQVSAVTVAGYDTGLSPRSGGHAASPDRWQRG